MGHILPLDTGGDSSKLPIANFELEVFGFYMLDTKKFDKAFHICQYERLLVITKKHNVSSRRTINKNLLI